MKIHFVSLSLALALASCQPAAKSVSLFDGRTLSGWTGPGGVEPGPGWTVVDGTLHLDGKGGNLLSAKEYENFEFEWEWKLSPGSNNGVKYWVTQVGGKEWLGIEYQMIDDEREPDAKKREGTHSTAAFYDIQAPAADKPLRPAGEWNHSRIVVQNGRLEHWLNGKKVGELDTRSEAWKQGLAASKFKDKVGFAPGKGRLMLTDHGGQVWYRNLRLTEK